MRRTRLPLLPALLVPLALVTAACATEAPGWTYAPPTEPPAATPARTQVAVASEAPAGSEAPSGDAIAIAALNVMFDTDELAVPAGTEFVIRFTNDDAGIPHNVEIRDTMGMSIWKGDLFNGVATKDYTVPALAAGTYQFVCTVHPNMVGTLTAG